MAPSNDVPVRALPEAVVQGLITLMAARAQGGLNLALHVMPTAREDSTNQDRPQLRCLFLAEGRHKLHGGLSANIGFVASVKNALVIQALGSRLELLSAKGISDAVSQVAFLLACIADQ